MKTLLALIVLMISWNASAQKDDKAGGLYWPLSDGIKRYVEYTPGHSDKPVVVMVNGLVYDLSRWNEMRAGFIKKGYGVLNYYMRGQHLTLRNEVKESGLPTFFKNGLSVDEEADELQEILEALDIQKPVVVLGLSYGAAAAAEFGRRYPKQIESLIFLAPLVISLENYSPEGQWVNANLTWIKMWWGPFFGPQFYEMAYSAIYRSYLAQRIIPDRVPEELRDMPDVYRESIFHLTRAVRTFDLRQYDFSEIGDHRVHFLLAKEEQDQAFKDQLKAFDSVDAPSQGALVWLTESGHAIPDSRPAEAVALIDALTQKNRSLESGKKYRFNGEGLSNW